MSKELNMLPPSIRQKKRYIKFKVRSEQEVKLGEVVDTVWDKCLNYLGTKETSDIDFWIIGNQFNEKNQDGIIKVNRDKLEEFRACLALIGSLGNKKGFIQVEKVSGSIKKCQSN